MGNLDLEMLWATASSARERLHKEAQNAVASTKVRAKPSKLKAAMERAEMQTKEANRKLPRSERDGSNLAISRYPIICLFLKIDFASPYNLSPQPCGLDSSSKNKA